MKLLPPPGPERKRLIFLVTVAAIGAVAYGMWGGGPPPRMDQTTGPPPTSNFLVNRGRATTSKPPAPTAPQPLRLAEIERVPDEPEAGRNLFRFGVPPPPPYKPPPPPPPPPPYVPPAYTPPPIPPVPLKLVTIIPDPDDPSPTKSRAYLTYEKGTGEIFEVFQGGTIDGRYRLLRVGVNDVVVSHLDGTGQRTLRR
jgi:hypothetical protein